MIKKIILSFLLFLNMLYAAELMSKAQYIKHEDVRIHFTNMTGQNQDWIGIYRDGTNNDWKNVIKWAWTKDISEGKLTFKGLKLGLYEARAFYNNSYKVETEKKFSVVGNDVNINLSVSYKNSSLSVTANSTVFLAGINPNPKDWIGVYKKDVSNDWANVIKWAWLKDFQGVDYGDEDFSFNNINLADGEYEVRYFLNNSFKTYMAETFKVGNDDLNIERLKPFFDNETLKVKLVVKELAPINHKPKDWVGLYKKSASNDWGNVIKWTWANAYVLNNDDDIDGPLISFGKVNLAAGEYEARYFLNNSFKTYMSTDFKVQ